MADAEGAEATITVEGSTVVKDRHAKRYRHPVLDERLRTERTDLEARLLRKARTAGVPVPAVESVEETRIVMERVTGTVLRDVFAEREELWPVIGEHVARLHRRDIIHGDLTTSNMVVDGDDLVFIDFGLGSFSDRTEDRATDLHLLRQMLHSSHTDVAEEAMAAILDGYREESGDGEAVVERMRAVAKRGRYK